MRRTILLSLIALLGAGVACNACAQRRGGGGPGVARGGRASNRARSAARLGLSGAYLPYDYDEGYINEPAPVLVEQPPPEIEPPAPPVAWPNGHAVITEYKWSAAELAASPSANALEPESEAFAIVLKDGSTLSAVMIYASDDGLHYVDPDERHLCVAMSKVDRAQTLKLNRARNLNLYLPAAQ